VAELTTRLRELNVVIYTNEVEDEQSKSPLADVTESLLFAFRFENAAAACGPVAAPPQEVMVLQLC
jgi:hypothetical protein